MTNCLDLPGPFLPVLRVCAGKCRPKQNDQCSERIFPGANLQPHRFENINRVPATGFMR